MTNQEFIQIMLIQETQKLLDAKFYNTAFFMAIQGIETLGAFMDKKPFAAKAQSKKRYHLAIRELFSKNYHSLANNGWLYNQLRCNSVHLSNTGGFVILTLRAEKKGPHLQEISGKRLFVIEDFILDFHNASNRLIEFLEKGDVKQKIMAYAKQL